MSNSGFTLVEFISVLVILSVLAVPVMIGFRGTDIGVNVVAEKIVQDLHYIQFRAMTHGERARINFDNDRYWFSNRQGNTIWPHPVSAGSAIMLPEDHHIQIKEKFIVFDSLGTPYIDAKLPGTQLSTSTTIVVSAHGYRQQIRISPETGKISLP